MTNSAGWKPNDAKELRDVARSHWDTRQVGIARESRRESGRRLLECANALALDVRDPVRAFPDALRKGERIAALPVQEFLRRCGAPWPSRCASPGSTHHRTARSPGSLDHPGRRYGHHRLLPHGREQRWPAHHGTDALTFELECSEESALSYRTPRNTPWSCREAP